MNTKIIHPSHGLKPAAGAGFSKKTGPYAALEILLLDVFEDSMEFKLLEGRTNKPGGEIINGDGTKIKRYTYPDKYISRIKRAVLHWSIQKLDHTWGWYDSKKGGKRTRNLKWRQLALDIGIVPLNSKNWNVGKIKPSELGIDPDGKLGRALPRLAAALSTGEKFIPPDETPSFRYKYKCETCGTLDGTENKPLARHILELTGSCIPCSGKYLLSLIRSLPPVLGDDEGYDVEDYYGG